MMRTVEAMSFQRVFIFSEVFRDHYFSVIRQMKLRITTGCFTTDNIIDIYQVHILCIFQYNLFRTVPATLLHVLE